MTDDALVFLSYARRSSLYHARALESALVTAGIRTFRDETEIADGDAFPERIIDALLASRVVVVFADPVYFEREYCRWELEAALAPLRRDGAEDQSASLRHIVVARPAERRISDELDRLPPAIRARQWPQASETDRLVSLVCDLLATSGQTLAERLGATAATELRVRLLEGSRVALPTLPGSVPRFPSVLPVSLRDAFVGRSEVLWRIDYLLRSRYGTLETVRPTVSIEGFGGVGKSRLALEYVHRYGHYYPGGLFWVDADTALERRNEQLYGILRALRPATPELVELLKNNVNVSARVADALSEIPTDSQVLYVVDNAPEPEPGALPTEITAWCPAPGHVALLITSRLRISLAEGVDPLALMELEPAAAVALLTQKLQRTRLHADGWTAIAEWVGRLPLALVLLNAALRTESISARRLRDLVARGAETTGPLDQQMDAIRGQVPKGSLGGVTGAFGLSYSLLPPDAQHLARLIANLAPDPVPEALLDGLGNNLASPQARAHLVARSFVTSIPQTSVPLFGRMHRVLAGFLRAQATNPQAELYELLGPLLGIFDWVSLSDPKAWPLMNASIPHALALAQRIGQLPPGDGLADASGLRGLIAVTLYAQGDLAAARTLQEQVLADSRRILGPDHQNTLAAAGNLALTLLADGELVAARILEEQVYADSRRVLGPEHADTLRAGRNLATMLSSLGDLATANTIQKQVLVDARRILGPDDLDTIAAAGALAVTLYLQGDLAAARTLQEQFLADRRRILGPDHPGTLEAAGNLAATLFTQGDLAAARTLQEQVLADRRRILGPDHPETVRAKGHLAATLFTQGDLAAARTLQEQVLADSRRILGPDHPNTLEAERNMAIMNGQEAFAAQKD
jgi:tetratricopeptide (TPR) repeat protein